MKCKRCSKVIHTGKKLCTVCEEKKVSKLYAEYLINDLKKKSKNPSAVLSAIKTQIKKMKPTAESTSTPLSSSTDSDSDYLPEFKKKKIDSKKEDINIKKRKTTAKSTSKPLSFSKDSDSDHLPEFKKKKTDSKKEDNQHSSNPNLYKSLRSNCRYYPGTPFNIEDWLLPGVSVTDGLQKKVERKKEEVSKKLKEEFGSEDFLFPVIQSGKQRYRLCIII